MSNRLKKKGAALSLQGWKLGIVRMNSHLRCVGGNSKK